VSSALQTSAAVDLARVALEAEGAAVGAHIATVLEDQYAVAHYFEAALPGYRGWQWCAVIAAAPGGEPTVSETALLPGPDSLTAPEWVPWEQRVRAGDLNPGDLLPVTESDPRIEPGYLLSGDPEIDDVAGEIGLGRERVLAREGRLDAARRWSEGEYGPDSEMARSTSHRCVDCAFYLPLAGMLRRCFGVCGNEFSADGHVVHQHYGCGAHSSVLAPGGAGSPAFEPYDDGAIEKV
jgi:hypothetical protein